MSAQPPSSSKVKATAQQVAQIVEAAERACDEMRAAAEIRAAERIAEAERAAELRVQAADEEAAEVRVLAEAEAQALRAEALEQAQFERERAQDRAREVVAEARGAAREVLREGEQLSGHLRELADSLRVNAERLLRDVRDAHTELNVRLDRVDLDGAGGTRASKPPPAASGARPRAAELDVPEFKPRRRR